MTPVASGHPGPVAVSSLKSAEDAAAPTLPAFVTQPLPEIERFLQESLASLEIPCDLRRAMEHALLGGGKRLRPLLVLHSCRAVGGADADCLTAAAAVEMIHAFSLVHDDLPALDDDDLRRGKPTVHKAFGEAMAILAGDGLMSSAFDVVAHIAQPSGLGGLLAGELARGTTQMIAGQVLDTLGGFAPDQTEAQRVAQIHTQKTGALILASCRMGGLCGLASGKAIDLQCAELEALSIFGRAIGLMFQIVDDLLDVEQTAEHIGKRTSKDTAAGKATYPGVHGIEASRAEISRLEARALSALDLFGKRAEGLRLMCQYMARRTK